MAAVATVLCGAFLGLSAATLAGAVVILRRARAAEALAREHRARAAENLEKADRTRAEGLRLLDEAKAMHANCRARPFSVVSSPNAYPLGLFGPQRGGVA